MRRVLLFLLSVLSLPLAAVPLSTVEGGVTMQGDPLPGCTVRLESSAEQRDLESLPFLESAMRRSDDPSVLVDLLGLFQSERADAVAVKFIEDESQLERYRELRDGLGVGVR